MRTSSVPMEMKVLVLASVLCMSGVASAEAQGGFFFQFSFFDTPVPPVDIPAVPPPDAESFSDTPAPAAAPADDNGLPVGLELDVAPHQPDTPAAKAAASLALSLANPDDSTAAETAAKPDPEDPLHALEAAADQGQPIALWRLGTMYESGEGVQKDDVRAFGYFSRIADENANTPPRSLEADIVAQSFVKVGEYYREGLPDAGIPKDAARSVALLMHAATYFADAEAQYEIGRLYLSGDGIGQSVLQGARWLSLAARKGHVAAQATLGDLLFNGGGLPPQPVEGLMWLTIARDHVAISSSEATWIDELLNKAMSIATPDQRSAALQAAAALGPQVSVGKRVGGG